MIINIRGLMCSVMLHVFALSSPKGLIKTFIAVKMLKR